MADFLSTQARIMITEWQALSKIILSHSVSAKEKPIANIEDLENFDIENLENITFSTGDETPNILTEKQLNTVLQGPFGAFVREKMSAYAQIARFRMEWHLQKEEIFKNKRAVFPESDQIPPKKLAKITEDQLSQMQNALDELVVQHNQEWKEFIEQGTYQVLSNLKQNQITLTDREIAELQEEELSTEILPRFVEIGLKLPDKDYTKLSCTNYVYLKTLLTVQSALSRQHQPHSLVNIEEKIKKFKSVWTAMEKQEQIIMERQRRGSEKIISSLIE